MLCNYDAAGIELPVLQLFSSDDFLVHAMVHLGAYLTNASCIRCSQLALGIGTTEFSAWALSKTTGSTLYVTTQTPTLLNTAYHGTFDATASLGTKRATTIRQRPRTRLKNLRKNMKGRRS